MDRVQADVTEDGVLTLKWKGREARFEGVEGFDFSVNRPYTTEHNPQGDIVSLTPTGETTITLTFKVRTEVPETYKVGRAT